MYIDPDSKSAKVLMVLVGLPVCTVILWILLSGFFRAYRSMGWPTSQGLILESLVQRNNFHGIPSSTAKIRYQYFVAGQQFENDTIMFGPGNGCSIWGYADRTVAKFPKGQKVDVYYDPDNSAISCLERGAFCWEDVPFLFLMVFCMCIGIKIFADFLRWLLLSRPRRELTFTFIL